MIDCTRRRLWPSLRPAATRRFRGSSRRAATAAASATSRLRRQRHRRHRRQHQPRRLRPLTEEEVFARKTVDQLNAEKPLDDVFFDLDKSELRDRRQARAAEGRDWMKKWTSVADHASKGTATRAAARSTTSRSATAAPPP